MSHKNPIAHQLLPQPMDGLVPKWHLNTRIVWDLAAFSASAVVLCVVRRDGASALLATPQTSKQQHQIV